MGEIVFNAPSINIKKKVCRRVLFMLSVIFILFQKLSKNNFFMYHEDETLPKLVDEFRILLPV